MKKIFSFLLTLSLPFMVNAQDCNIPEPFTGNTGSNMTVMLTSTFIQSLPVTSASAYLVALTPDNLVVGSVVVAGVSQESLAIWGDESPTDDVIDGAQTGEAISFQLVDGSLLHDVNMPDPVTYSSNGLSAQLTDATSSLCTADDGGDDDSPSGGTPIEYQLSSGWNMVGYVGTAENNGIVDQMNAALATSDIQSTFQVIKNVKGKFWSSSFAQINEFIPGEGYMMYVIGTPTTVNFQSSGYISDIEYPLSSGWNMVAFTGDVDAESDIVTSINTALPSGTAQDKFQVIKNVKGKFWSASFAQINDFIPGEAYMMYVLGDPTNLNFQR